MGRGDDVDRLWPGGPRACDGPRPVHRRDGGPAAPHSPEEIEALADAMERAHPDDPGYGAFVEEEAVWFRSDGFARGRWLRVRKRLRERMAQRP